MSRDRYIRRSVTEENFAHCLSMFPMGLVWAENIREGHHIDFNDINMVQIPSELLEAFIERAANDPSDPLSAACKAVVAQIAVWRAVYAPKAKKRKRAKPERQRPLFAGSVHEHAVGSADAPEGNLT